MCAVRVKKLLGAVAAHITIVCSPPSARFSQLSSIFLTLRFVLYFLAQTSRLDPPWPGCFFASPLHGVTFVTWCSSRPPPCARRIKLCLNFVSFFLPCIFPLLFSSFLNKLYYYLQHTPISFLREVFKQHFRHNLGYVPRALILHVAEDFNFPDDTHELSVSSFCSASFYPSVSVSYGSHIHLN